VKITSAGALVNATVSTLLLKSFAEKMLFSRGVLADADRFLRFFSVETWKCYGNVMVTSPLSNNVRHRAIMTPFLEPRASVLVFGAPRKSDLFGHLSEKRENMPILCVVLPEKYYLLLCRLWFYNCVGSSTEIKAFPTSF